MDIIVNTHSLDLPTGFTVELELNSPLFTRVGSQSLPVTLPYSAHNLAVLGNPQRIARSDKYVSEHPATIRHSLFHLAGRLVVFKANRQEGIACTFYLREGDFYTQLQDVQLADLDMGGVRTLPGDTREDQARAWVVQLEEVMHSGHPDYAVFPIATKYDPDFGKHEFINMPDFSGNPAAYPLLGKTARKPTDVLLPVGYGVSAFLYLHRVLDWLFAHFGYTFKTPSLFHTDSALSRIVLLNSVADAVCAGTLSYADLVPDMSVSDFLSAISDSFDCVFDIDSGKRQVEVVFFRDVAVSPFDLDLSPYTIGDITPEHEPFKQLTLTAGTAIPYAEPPAASLDTLQQTNGFIPSLSEAQFKDSTFWGSHRLAFRRATNMFYNVGGSPALPRFPIAVMAGSRYFNHSRNLTLEAEERTAANQQVPLLSFSHPGAYPKDYFTPFVNERIHLKTGLLAETDNTVEEETVGQKRLMFCFSVGMVRGLGMGTPFRYNADGEPWGSLSLCLEGSDGLFAHFWQQREAMLADAFRPVRAALNLPVTDFLQLDMLTPKLINGVKVVPVSVKYSISEAGLRIAEATFMTLRRQQPESDLPVAGDPPPAAAYPYYWIAKDNLEEVLDYYGEDSGPGKIELPELPMNEYPPPTQEQYESGQTFHPEEHYVEVLIYESQGNLSGREETFYTSWLEVGKH